MNVNWITILGRKDKISSTIDRYHIDQVIELLSKAENLGKREYWRGGEPWYAYRSILECTAKEATVLRDLLRYEFEFFDIEVESDEIKLDETYGSQRRVWEFYFNSYINYPSGSDSRTHPGILAISVIPATVVLTLILVIRFICSLT